MPRSTGLIAIDPPGPTSDDLQPDERLGDAPHLQALYEPTPRLNLTPRRILQRIPAWTWRDRARRLGLLGFAALLVNAALGVAFFVLLSFRDAELPREVEIPIEVITEPPKAPAKPSGAGAPQADGKGGGGQAGASQQAQSAGPAPRPPQPQGQTPPPPEPLPAPPKPPQPAAAPTSPKAGPPSPPPQQASDGPKLVAAQADAPRAATQTHDNKLANLQPDEHQTDAATREAKPVAVPQALTTADPKASFAVPAPVEAKPAVDKPTPPTVAKTPSATDMLAAALPMDTSAMPSSFRAVLAGNNAAQLKAAYAGVVQGRLAQAQPEIVDTAYSQHLKGAVSVMFTLDPSGNLADVSIVQSSGDPKLDALALHWIQLAAPFPPPPPDAERTFKKALLFGN